jgi:hypothetical protein
LIDLKERKSNSFVKPKSIRQMIEELHEEKVQDLQARARFIE